MAYIIPAYKVFDDIENRFGVPPRLPSETAPDPNQNRIIQSSKLTQNHLATSLSSAAAIKFPDSIRKLWLRTQSISPRIHVSRQEYNRVQRQFEPISYRIEEVSCSKPHLEMLAVDSNNRIANVKHSLVAAFGQRIWCQPSGTSRQDRFYGIGGVGKTTIALCYAKTQSVFWIYTRTEQLLEFHTRQGYTKKAQILRNSYFQAPLVTERRRTRIPARALTTGVEPLRDSMVLVSPRDDSYFKALYGWCQETSAENLDFAFHHIQGPTHSKNQSVDVICINHGEFAEMHAQLSLVDNINAKANCIMVLLDEGAAYSYATMASVRSIQQMISGYMEEVKSRITIMRRSHRSQQVPMHLDFVSLERSRRSFETDFPDSLRTPCARLDLPRSTACLESSDDESTRFRARINKAARLAYLASCLTDSSGDPRHLNEDTKALTSRFDDLLCGRWLSEIKAACGDALGKLQQHGASLGNNYYRRLPIGSMGKPNLHVLLPATLSRFRAFLQRRRNTMASSDSLQCPLCYLTATQSMASSTLDSPHEEMELSPLGATDPSLHPRHIERHLSGYHNALAHFEGTLQSLMDGMDRKTPVESIPQPLEQKTRPWIVPWIVGLDGNQIISLFTGDHQSFPTSPPSMVFVLVKQSPIQTLVTSDYWRDRHGMMCFEMEAAGLMDDGFPYLVIQGICDDAESNKEVRWRLRSERLRIFFWRENE